MQFFIRCMFFEYFLSVSVFFFLLLALEEQNLLIYMKSSLSFFLLHWCFSCPAYIKAMDISPVFLSNFTT